MKCRGDACDEDMDNDGILNEVDNCPIAYNPDQVDLNRRFITFYSSIIILEEIIFIRNFSTENGVGDVCEDDFDMDNVPNYLDNCPNNSKIFSTDFRSYQTVALGILFSFSIKHF